MGTTSSSYPHLREMADFRAIEDSSNSDVFRSILAVWEGVSGTESDYLAQFSIGAFGFAVLLLLGIEESVVSTPTKLMDALGVPRQVITGTLDSLEASGLVVRELDWADRRSILAVGTPKARDLLKRILPGYFQVASALSGVLTPDEQTEFIRLCAKLRGSAGDIESQPDTARIS